MTNISRLRCSGFAAIEADATQRRDAEFDPLRLVRLAARFPSSEMENRRAYYSRFITLISTYPDADIDMGLAAAQRVFSVRIGVMRRDIEGAKEMMRAA